MMRRISRDVEGSALGAWSVRWSACRRLAEERGRGVAYLRPIDFRNAYRAAAGLPLCSRPTKQSTT